MELREYLSQHREPCPAWLEDFCPGSKLKAADLLRNFLLSKIVYYPGSGEDGDPVAAFNAAHVSHCFIYADYLTTRQQLRTQLHVQGFCGYHNLATVDIQLADFQLGNIFYHATLQQCPAPQIEPYAFLEIFERIPSKGDQHGAKRFAILFLAADGHAAYDALFCQDQSRSVPVCVVVQDHGFGGNWS